MAKKKLKINYSKPFPIYYDRPENAESILKEVTASIDFEKDTIFFIDETSVKILWNVRRFHLKDEKNIRKVSSKRISLNAVGALSINVKGFISFPEKTNVFTVTEYILNLMKENTINEKIKNEIDEVLNHENTEIDYIKEYIKSQIMDDEKFNQKIEKIQKLSIDKYKKSDKITRLLNKIKVTSKKIDYQKRKNQETNILESNLKNKFKNYKILWDNARVHTSSHVKTVCDFLGIEIIQLPVKCPDYNPIEYPWADTKKSTAELPIDDEYILQKSFAENFYNHIKNNDYTNYFIKLVNKLHENTCISSIL
jgi:transposase